MVNSWEVQERKMEEKGEEEEREFISDDEGLEFGSDDEYDDYFFAEGYVRQYGRPIADLSRAHRTYEFTLLNNELCEDFIARRDMRRERRNQRESEMKEQDLREFRRAEERRRRERNRLRRPAPYPSSSSSRPVQRRRME